MCDQLHQTYIDKMSLENYMYSMQITMTDEKNNPLLKRENNIAVNVSIVSIFETKTKVKDFESIFYRVPNTFLGSTYIKSWIDLFIGNNVDVYHSGPIVLDNSGGSLVLIQVTVPKKKLEINSMTIRSTLDVNFIMYYLVRLMPLLILSIAFVVSINATVFSSLIVAIMIVRCLQKGEKEKDEGSQPAQAQPIPPAPTAESARLVHQYYQDLD